MISVVMTPALLKMATAAWAAVAPFTPFILVAAALGLIFDDLKHILREGSQHLENFGNYSVKVMKLPYV